MRRFSEEEINRTRRSRHELPSTVTKADYSVICHVRDRLHLLLNRQLFTGSWAGIFVTIWLVVRSIWSEMVSMRRSGSKRHEGNGSGTIDVPLSRHVIMEVSRDSQPGKRASRATAYAARAEEYVERLASADNDLVRAGAA
jgi:hypothetical protein